MRKIISLILGLSITNYGWALLDLPEPHWLGKGSLSTSKAVMYPNEDTTIVNTPINLLSVKNPSLDSRTVMNPDGPALNIDTPVNLWLDKEPIVASKAAMNPYGAAVIVWLKSHDRNTHSLQACSRSNVDAPWDTTQFISKPMNIQMFFPAVTFSGTSTVIWNGFDSHQIQYYYSKNTNGYWIPSQAIYDPALTLILDAIIDVDNEDPLVIAASPKEPAIYSYHYKNKKSYREFPILPGSDAEPTFAPQLITNQRGKIFAIWGNLVQTWLRRHTDYHLFISPYDSHLDDWGRKTDLGSLNFRQLKDDQAKDISASLNNKNQIAVIWSHFDAASFKYTLKTLIDHTTEKLKDSLEGFTDPSILMDEEGNTVAVWIQQLNKQNVVYASFKPRDKNTWLGEPKLLSNVNNKAGNVRLSFHKGTFVVVWDEESSSPNKRSIFGATLLPKTEKFEWTPVLQLSPTDQSCWHPSIAFGDKGGIITWITQNDLSKDFGIQVANLTVP